MLITITCRQLCSVLILAHCAVAQAADQPKTPTRLLDNHSAAFFPLKEGAHWRYHTEKTKVKGLQPTKSKIDFDVIGSYRRNNNTVFLVRTAGEVLRFEHWLLEPAGLLIFPGKDNKRISAHDPEIEPRIPLACPVGAVYSWQWVEDEKPTEWHWQARLENYTAKVTVPAGTFDCVHIQSTGTDGADTGTRDFWYARGVGCVKELIEVGELWELRELAAFEPGRDCNDIRHGMLEFQLPTNWMWSATGPTAVHWLDKGVESLALPGRFALLDDGTNRRCAFVDARGARMFDATDSKAWLDLIGLVDQNPTARPSADTFARLVARVMAHQTKQTVLDLCKDEARWPRKHSLADEISLPVTLLVNNRAQAMELRLDLQAEELAFHKSSDN